MILKNLKQQMLLPMDKEFNTLMDSLYKKEWVVYSKTPNCGMGEMVAEEIIHPYTDKNIQIKKL